MAIIDAIILGLVEGTTEFLPISSTAHLIITGKLLNIPQTDFVSFFEVFIQSGAILAVVFLYIKYIIQNRSYALKIFASFIPTAIFGYLLYGFIKTTLFNSINIISLSLFSVGIIFIIIEVFIKRGKLTLTKTLKDLNYMDAFVIGIIQSIAIVPGVSRAGAVIVGMMALKYKRSESVIYSFLLAVPTIFAASVFDFIKTDLHGLSINSLVIVGVGFVVSFISALFLIQTFIVFIKKNNLVSFGYYRIAIALTILLLYTLNNS